MVVMVKNRLKHENVVVIVAIGDGSAEYWMW